MFFSASANLKNDIERCEKNWQIRPINPDGTKKNCHDYVLNNNNKKNSIKKTSNTEDTLENGMRKCRIRKIHFKYNNNNNNK